MYATTKQVRDVMHKHGIGNGDVIGNEIYTNKRKSENGLELRSVKCYNYGTDLCDDMIAALKNVAGENNVRIKEAHEHQWKGIGSIIVTCVLG